ncbi:MAG: hypothetical protein AAFN00_22670, partial [Cyanobacteria bacterium J06558_2]
NSRIERGITIIHKAEARNTTNHDVESVLWMIVIPLSILELSLKAKAKAQKKIVHESNNPDATLEITAHEIGELNPSNS